LAPVPSEVLAVLDKGPLAIDLITPIHDRNDLLRPGKQRAEIGYAALLDGTGYAAMFTRMPGVTVEMFDWWFMWHGLDGLRYRIWCPTEHFDAQVEPASRLRRLDSSLSVRERTWGTTDLVRENVGAGPANIYISFQSPEAHGLDKRLLEDAQEQTVLCANAGLADARIPIITFMHVARKVGGGVEVRSRFWEGWQVADGKPVKVAPPGGVPLEAVKGCAYHCAVEFANLASILPDLYRDHKDAIEAGMAGAAP
jgi:hypothetical protein